MATIQSAIVLPPLPYAKDALEPYMSRETLDYHYGKHHKAYVDKVNNLIGGTEFGDASLEELVAESAGEIFNNAAQVWNHTFFWNCLSPRRQSPGREISRALEALGGFESFQTQFDQAASGLFGSGWTWLVKKSDGSVDIVNMGAAGTPLTTGDKPLMTIDVWEHAYYIDFRNLRPKFVETFLTSLVNWDFAEKNFG